MRYIPTYCLREGMIVGKDLYGVSNQLLLRNGTKLVTHYITKLKELGLGGIYVSDEISSDIYIEEVINQKLRLETTQTLKEIFTMSEKNPNASPKEKEKKFYLSQEQIENIVDEIIENKNLMVNMIDLKTFDDYTFAHSVNVAVLSIIIGIGLDLPKNKLYKLGLGALLHDMGKVFVGTGIVNKPGKLTDDEFIKMKEHSKYGYDYLKKEFNLYHSSYLGVLDHHEKYNGTGYPSQLKGDKISLFGRIIAIADVYDALTSARPYRKGMLPSEAIEYIMCGSEAHFDPKIVKVFLSKIAPYPLGMCVKLSCNKSGIVIENFAEACLRPRLRIFEENGLAIEPYEISLRDDSNYLSSVICEIL